MEFLNFEGLAYFKEKENSQFAPVESTTTASQAYEIGQYFWYEGKLYEATAAIALGDTFVTSGDSANCELADIAVDISDARERISTLEGQVTDLETNKANIDGYYSEMTVGNAEQIVSTVGVEDKTPYNFRTAGGSVDIGDREEDMVVGGTVAWNQLVTTDTNVSKTKSGDIITVNDAVAGNAEDLVVSFEPQQDLHGYDSPWPAGGNDNIFGGAAMMDSFYEVGQESSKDVSAQTVTFYGKSGAPAVFSDFKPNTRYTFILKLKNTNANTGTNVIVTYTDSSLSYIDKASNTDVQTIVFTSLSGKTVYSLALINAGGATTIYCDDSGVFEGVLTASQFKPYENICPITGWTGCEVNRASKNLTPITSDPSNPDAGMTSSGGGTIAFAYDSTEGAFYTNNHRSTNFYPPVTGTYTVSFYAKRRTGGTSAYSVLGEGNKFPTAPSSYSTEEYIRYGYQFNMTKGVRFNLTIYSTIFVKDFQIEFSNTLTAHEDYDTDIYPVSWQSEAGTVYGGTWNPVKGKLRATTVTADLGDLQWTEDPNRAAVRYASLPNCKNSANKVVSCSCYKYGNRGIGQISDFEISGNISYSGTTCFFWDSRTVGMTRAEVQALLSGEKVAYLLATPIEYTLTAQQIALLAGTNNVWNTIGSTQMTYLGTLNEITAQNGHKYLTRVNGSSTVVNGSGQTLSGEKARDNIFDLTQMFGSSIADYVYSLENTSAGDGVTWFTDLFPKPYYSYNAGQLMSVNTSAHKTVGFNAWDEQWEVGAYNTTNGTAISGVAQIRSKNFIPVLPNTSYFFHSGTQRISYTFWYDADKEFIEAIQATTNDKLITSPSNAHYLHIQFPTVYGTTYLGSACVNLSWDGERDGEYEAYEEHTYALDESLTLRGIPKLDSGNKLYYDGDTYESDGTVTRKYAYGEVKSALLFGEWDSATGKGAFWYTTFGVQSLPTGKDSGNQIVAGFETSDYVSQNTIKQEFSVVGSGIMRWVDLGHMTDSAADYSAYLANNPIKFVYELAEPTTESVDPYTNPQIVSDWGTEEYVDYSALSNEREVSIPVGHVTVYQNNLRAKLEMAPESPSDGDGDYIVRQTNGENEYVKLIIPNELPEVPTEAGTYILQVTISSGTATYSWVSAT